MEIFYTRTAIRTYSQKAHDDGKVVGFVPTMGALHDGHLSLIKAASDSSDVVICSIFVNPTQFNDKGDLDNYPRPLDSDIDKLILANCDAVFVPGIEEMYDQEEEWYIDLKNLDDVLEGAIRPGHYQGVTQIVSKLFNTVKPDIAFFGQKDFQQFTVISHMVKQSDINIELRLCPIIREPSGLAMSSRNIHLTEEEKKDALALYRSLLIAKQEFMEHSIQDLKLRVTGLLNSSPGIDLEYFEIFDADTFSETLSKRPDRIIALVAAKVGKIRIIDNMFLKQPQMVV